MASSETTAVPENWPLPASDHDRQDTVSATSYDTTITHPSNIDENQAEEPAGKQAEESKEMDKGKGKNKKKGKRGVMSLPAEIRET